MSHTFTRQELFDLVWPAPTRTVAKQLSISDVGLAKACRRADLLLPPRGWARSRRRRRRGGRSCPLRGSRRRPGARSTPSALECR